MIGARLGRRLPAISTALLVGWFLLIDWFELVVVMFPKDSLGGDGRLYSHAAAAWLAGGDPWAIREWGYGFAGPPISLIPFALTAWMPFRLAGFAWVVAGLVAAVVVVRRLRLPWWWLLFPPFIEAIWVGSMEPVVLATLVIGPHFLAPIAKVYTAIPLVAERRWRPLVIALAIGLATIPLLPWGTYVREYGSIAAVLDVQAPTDRSAWGEPALWAMTAIALLLLGRRRAGYLAVPALWPQAQLHYALIALPVLGNMKLVAAAAATPLIPFLMPLAVIYAAGREVIHFILREDPAWKRSGWRSLLSLS